MPLVEINRNPDKRELTIFGVLLALFTGIIGAIAWWKFRSPRVATWIWSIGGGLSLLYLVLPPFRKPFYIFWVTATYPIGWVVSHILLGIVYYLVVTPIGCLVRWTGRVTVRAPIDPDAKTYWIERPSTAEPARYLRQF